MEHKNLIYKHRIKVRSIGLLLLLSGIILAYFCYGTEPQETIGGFLCGLGVSLLLIGVAVKKSN